MASKRIKFAHYVRPTHKAALMIAATALPLAACDMQVSQQVVGTLTTEDRAVVDAEMRLYRRRAQANRCRREPKTLWSSTHGGGASRITLTCNLALSDRRACTDVFRYRDKTHDKRPEVRTVRGTTAALAEKDKA